MSRQAARTEQGDGPEEVLPEGSSPWCLGGNGGMDPQGSSYIDL